jgi:hypothetical protein
VYKPLKQGSNDYQLWFTPIGPIVGIYKVCGCYTLEKFDRIRGSNEMPVEKDTVITLSFC